MIKIAIVGPEESKWKPGQIPKVKKQIRDHLFGLQCPKCNSFEIESIGYKRVHIDSEGGIDAPFWKCRNCGYEAEWGYQEWIIQEPIVLVSGHCPKGGVDIWAEEIADELGIKKEIYPAEADKEGKYHWDDKREFDPKTYDEHIMGGAFYFYAKLRKLKGYRSRNIKVAEACDVLYCLVPFRYTSPNYEDVKFNNDLRCIHCKKSRHPTNGGCWTMKCAKKLGKEVHLVVIE